MKIICNTPGKGREPLALIKGHDYILDADFNVSCKVTLVDFGKVYANVKSCDGTGREWYTNINNLSPLPPAQPVKAVEEETIICGQTCGCKTSCNAPQPTLSETPAIESVEGLISFTDDDETILCINGYDGAEDAKILLSEQ